MDGYYSESVRHRVKKDLTLSTLISFCTSFNSYPRGTFVLENIDNVLSITTLNYVIYQLN